jgi:3-methyladenine DNA glycosylase AlkD
MKPSTQAAGILANITGNTRLGDLRNIAKEIKKDHALALELWHSGQFVPRLLAMLIMDNKLLSSELINSLFDDIRDHSPDEQNQLADWLMANQLTKNKKTIALIESWENNPDPLRRRLFWYYQGRLRWVGQAPPDNTAHLVSAIESNINGEHPQVQWAMNFTAGWIGVYDKQYRKRCITIGETTGLYKGKMVSKGCTPEYLPEFIAIEANKRNL